MTTAKAKFDQAYNDVCDVIDSVKNDDRSEKTMEYAEQIMQALHVTRPLADPVMTQMSMRTALRRKFEDENGNPIDVEARYGINKTAHVYFTLTCEYWYLGKNGRRLEESGGGGADHELIVAAFPWLAPMSSMHLSDAVTGEPMHAAANAWTMFTDLDVTGSPRDPRYGQHNAGLSPAQAAAKYLRCDPEVFSGMPRAATHGDAPVRKQFYDRVELLRPVWEAQALTTKLMFGLEMP